MCVGIEDKAPRLSTQGLSHRKILSWSRHLWLGRDRHREIFLLDFFHKLWVYE